LPEQDLPLLLGAVDRLAEIRVDLFRPGVGALGRGVLSQPSTVHRWRRTARSAVGIVVPAVAVAAAMAALSGGAHWSNVVLLHWALRPGTGNIFWFVEALLLIMIAITALLSVERLRAWYAADPWRVAFLLTVALLVPRYLVLALVDGPVRGLPWTVAWLFTAGLAMGSVQTRVRRMLTVLVAAGGTVGFFPAAERNLVIILGLVLLALVPTVVVPRVLVRPLGVLAAASLHVYLVQFQLFAFFPSPALKFAGALATGLAFWWASTGLLRRLQSRVPLITTSERPLVRPLTHRKDYLCADAPS
jgi:hypothetical protein